MSHQLIIFFMFLNEISGCKSIAKYELKTLGGF